MRQNGIVDLKTDISPLLLSGIVETQQQSSFSAPTSTATTKVTPQLSHSASTASLIALQNPQDFVLVNNDGSGSNGESNEPANANPNDTNLAKAKEKTQVNEEEMHMNKLRQLLGAGQRADAIEFAIKNNMWPHALFLASSSSLANAAQSSIAATNELKVLNKVKARFICSLPSNDPIQTCYQLLIGRIPTITSVSSH